MSDFLDKYYPGIGKQLFHKRIENLRELLKTETEEYKKKYKEMPE